MCKPHCSRSRDFLKTINCLQRALLCCLVLCWCAPVWAHHKVINVTFINPGLAEESFWGDVDRFMQAAADQLHVDLTILHGNRDVFHTLSLGESLAHRQDSSDFVILVNEKNTGPRLLSLLSGGSAKILFILNNLTSEQESAFGRPRVDVENWLGALVPDNHWVGYHTARQIHEAMLQTSPFQEHFRWLAISGDQSTPASQQRERGLLDYVHEHRDISLVNIVYGEWQEARAYDLTKVLLQRSANVDGLWTANDHMAFGAIKALREEGLTPGKDVYLSSVNSSVPVIDALENGTISSLGAGHFTAGGWILVLAYDYMHGYDGFADQQVMQQALFELIRPHSKTASILRESTWDQVDFSRFSRALNPQWQGYNFSLSEEITP